EFAAPVAQGFALPVDLFTAFAAPSDLSVTSLGAPGLFADTAIGDLYGGTQYASLDTGSLFGPSRDTKVQGPSSDLYAAATDEGTMITTPEQERRAEQETRVADAGPVPFTPTVTDTSGREMPFPAITDPYDPKAALGNFGGPRPGTGAAIDTSIPPEGFEVADPGRAPQVTTGPGGPVDVTPDTGAPPNAAAVGGDKQPGVQPVPTDTTMPPGAFETPDTGRGAPLGQPYTGTVWGDQPSEQTVPGRP